MAKVIETTVIPEPVVPPRTFAVELNEEEMDTLLVILATTVPVHVNQEVRRVAENFTYNEVVRDAAQRLSDAGNNNISHGLYDDFVRLFNG